jgi:hypothetical protein
MKFARRRRKKFDVIAFGRVIISPSFWRFQPFLVLPMSFIRAECLK